MKKISIFIGTIVLIISIMALPCFATFGDISAKSISGWWGLRFRGNIGSFNELDSVRSPFTTTTIDIDGQTQTVIDGSVGDGVRLHNLFPQVLPDVNNNNLALFEIRLEGHAVAYYDGPIGSRGFDGILVGYWLNYADSTMIPCVIALMNEGASGELTSIVDTIEVMVDPLNTVFSNNLSHIDFNSQEFQKLGSDIFSVKNALLKLFGTNAYGGSISYNGVFIPLDNGIVEPSEQQTFKEFLLMIFDIIGSILSIEFFGWISIGGLVAVSLSLGMVLLFLKYFAGG